MYSHEKFLDRKRVDGPECDSQVDLAAEYAQFSTQDRLELLVEDELPHGLHGQLFCELDKTPEKWRELALSFVQQRAMQQTVAAASAGCLEELVREAPTSDSTSTGMKQTWSLNDWSWVASLAAALLFAFGIGWFSGPGSGSFAIWQSQSDTDLQSDQPELAMQEGSVQVYPESSLGSKESSKGTDADDPAGKPEAVPGKSSNPVVGYATWVGNYGPQRSPVFLQASLDAGDAKLNPPELHPRLKQEYARAGMKALPRRRIVSLALENGPQLTIPLDDWEVRRVVISRETL